MPTTGPLLAWLLGVQKELKNKGWRVMRIGSAKQKTRAVFNADFANFSTIRQDHGLGGKPSTK